MVLASFCWVWSLIILFILYHNVGPLYLNGVAMSPVIKRCVGGPRGGAAATLWSPPLAGGFGGSAPEAKNRCKIAL